MFSSNSSTNLSSSCLSFPAVFAGYDNNKVLPNHQHDPLSGFLLPAIPRIPGSLKNIAFTGNNTTMIKQNFNSLKAECYDASKLVPIKRTVKKDRHRKICTAQGLRDRRVRLSIEIAREFFNLQDKLGFEKPSETLQWLLNKSRNAIKELAGLKHTDNIGSTRREVVYVNGDLERISRSELLESISEKKQTEKLRKTALQVLAKESRDKARARARERTREKICTRLKFHEYKKVADTCPQVFNQFRSLSQFKACEVSTSFASSSNVVAEVKGQPWSHELANQAPMKDVSQQGSNSNVLKTKQNPSSICTHQENLEISKDVSCNSNCNLPENWGITNSAMPQCSTSRAITANVNFSTVKLPE